MVHQPSLPQSVPLKRPSATLAGCAVLLHSAKPAWAGMESARSRGRARNRRMSGCRAGAVCCQRGDAMIGAMSDDAFETLEGAAAPLIFICDHAANALPDGYG